MLRRQRLPKPPPPPSSAGAALPLLLLPLPLLLLPLPLLLLPRPVLLALTQGPTGNKGDESASEWAGSRLWRLPGALLQRRRMRPHRPGPARSRRERRAVLRCFSLRRWARRLLLLLRPAAWALLFACTRPCSLH